MAECGVPGFEGFIGKKMKPEYVGIAKRQGSYSYCVFRATCDPVIAYFKPDGTITNFSGGGMIATIKQNGKEVTRYIHADLDSNSVHNEVRQFIMDE